MKMCGIPSLPDLSNNVLPRSAERATDGQTAQPTSRSMADRPVDQLTNQLTDRLTARLADRLTDQSTGFLRGRRLLSLHLIVSLVWFGLCLLVSGCNNAEQTPVTEFMPTEPQLGGVYRRAFNDGFLVTDPALVKDSISHEVCRQLFDGLVEFDADAQVVPALAATWTISPDRLSYQFTLRSGVTFHSVQGSEAIATRNGGRELNAEDVRYTFRRLLDPQQALQRGNLFFVIQGAKAFAEGEAEDISGLVAVDSRTVRFTLEKPFAPFLSLLAMCNAFIVPREDVENPDYPFASAPIGTGPFRWGGRTDDLIILLANIEHFRGRPYLDGLEFPVIPDEYARFNAFKSGTLMHVDVPDTHYQSVKQDPKWAALFQETSRWGTFYLGFNITVPPFDQQKVRQAINWAIDREAIVKIVLNERARVAKGVLPPGIPAFNPDLRGYSYDLEKARELLAEAGYPKGEGLPTITLQFNQDPAHARTSELVLANLRDIGIHCRVQEVDFMEHLSSVESGASAFFRMGWTVDYPDPDNFLHTLFHSGNSGAGGNFSRYDNPRVDDLLERARFEVEPKKRIPLYQQAEQIIVDDAPWVFVYHYTTHLLAQPTVHGIIMTPMGSPFIPYRQIWLDKPANKPVNKPTNKPVH